MPSNERGEAMNVETGTYYKIRSPYGLYSCGGGWPTFNKKGKTWKTIAHLRAHINLVRHALKESAYVGCVVEVLDVKVEVKEELDYKREVLEPFLTQQEKRERIKRIANKKAKINRLEKQIEQHEKELKELKS